MLPTTPLHHLLFDALLVHGIKALVMTSGNVSDEPICLANDEAKKRLATIADAYVLHDREILRRADDSVLQVVDGKPRLLRRSRGLAPVPIFSPMSLAAPAILATGTQLKNTVCLLKDGRAFLSPHIGDLGQLETDGFFRESISTLQDLLECTPQVIAHDMHPQYTATLWAQQQREQNPECQLVPVQHHHAHMAAVIAEHQLPGPVVGLIMDGTGYGSDGTIWGGEILFGDAAQFTRIGHLEPVPLPGGDAAIKAPWRQAVSYLHHTFGAGFFAENPQEFPFQADRPVDAVLEILSKNLNSPLTSSCGRLFDAVAAMVGPWTEASYEAQAAIELTALTTPQEVRRAQPFALVAPPTTDGNLITCYEGHGDNSIFTWWDHWPVSQKASDGRRAESAEKPSCSSLCHFALPNKSTAQWEPYAESENKVTKLMMHGMTNKKVEEIVPVAKSWLSPCDLKISGKGFASEGYDPTQMAYLLEMSEPESSSPVSFTMDATEESPLINPAFVIKNWGSREVELSINGKVVERGADFRYGIENRMEGTDLVVWIKRESTQPVSISLKPM